MERWDRKRYEHEKRSFIQRRVHQAPLWGQFAFLFGAPWGAAWFCSWLLWMLFARSHAWAASLPIRYTIAFVFAYACFFIAVRIWLEIVEQEPHQQGSAADYAGAAVQAVDPLVIFALIAGFIIGGLFLAVGGAPMLLEVAFEAAFAGIVVTRPLSGDLVLGNWKKQLLENTWKKALFGLLILIAMAAWLQQQAPQASTLAQVINTMSNQAEKTK